MPGVPQAPVETSAHSTDRERAEIHDRPWYQYAARVLPPAGEAGRWIDLGCGRGEFLEQVRSQHPGGFGLDYWPPNAASAAKRGHPAVAADLNLGLPFRDQSFDGVALVEVIEHIVRAEDLVAEIARVIRPGGWLVITTPNVVHWTYRWRTLTGHPPKQEGYHYRFFTQRTLGKLLERAGFRQVAYASFGKQALLTLLARALGKRPQGAKRAKVRYVVPRLLESLLAQHFVWRLERVR